MQAGPCVDADGFVRALVGEGHRFGGAGVSNAHCTHRTTRESGGSRSSGGRGYRISGRKTTVSKKKRKQRKRKELGRPA